MHYHNKFVQFTYLIYLLVSIAESGPARAGKGAHPGLYLIKRLVVN